MPSCREIDWLIQLDVDGEIGVTERQSLHEHVKTCASCRIQWEEMVSLVQSLEEIGNEERMQKRRTLLLPVKWGAVLAAVTLLLLISPVRSVPSPSSPAMVLTAKPSQQMFEMVVLATQTEELHIPDDENIRVIRPRDEAPPLPRTAWIYPSAVPFLQNEDPSWLKKVNQFIFVKVPDMDTLNKLLTTVGIPLHPDQLRISDLRFPTSVILKTGRHPRIETFQFPDNKQAVSRWFHKIATQASLP
ncbi:anti-sigma factor family protein [Lihuaxuella thermophila]|uniref:Putative zinc-finger n=1 Tax=Lihuaxuella thermophila TaxID=1173111 RepID=A0A1H8AGS4_9BACL|nr:zf-HC2 domain-containing protein [Lihuaxuella thermophila]SEM69811.1 Putative zinc-finger [Lihuaxuella thermophila]